MSLPEGRTFALGVKSLGFLGGKRLAYYPQGNLGDLGGSVWLLTH